MEIEHKQDEILFDQNVTPLCISEVYLVLNRVESRRNQRIKENNINYLHFDNYIKEFTPSKQQDEIQNLRTELNSYFENKINSNCLVELLNLMPSSLEEAKSLIRNLNGEEDEIIQEIIDFLNRQKKI